jgi:hypothetical protein
MKNIIFILINTLLLGAISAQDTTPQKIVEQNPSRQNYFGESGDIDGNYAVAVGIHSENPNAWKGGVVNVYKQNTKGTWEFNRAMFPKVSDSEDRFGQGACALSGNNVIVGDWMNAKQEFGAAHIFNFWGDTLWRETAYLAPKNTLGVESFGRSVDIYGNYAVVGASNAVYIFELQIDNTWQEIKKLTKTNAGGFGQHVAIHGNYLIVSAEWEGIDGIKNSGAVYVYYNSNKVGWKYLQKIKLSAEETKIDAKFGSSISIFKNNIVIGYPKANMGEILGAGNVYVYERTKLKFELKQKLFAEDFGFNKYGFGDQVSISENYIAIGENQGREYQGSVYLFEKIEEEFKQVNRFSSGKKSYHGNDFGQNGLSLSKNNLFVGFPGDDFCNEKVKGCGSAYFYTLQKTPSKKDIPAFIPQGLTKKMIDKKMKPHNADSILFDDINGDDVYLLRSSTTGLWGMYQADKVIIPMKYEYINFYGWNDPFTFVKKDNKWCIYYGGFSDDNHAVHCDYEELKKFTHQGYIYVAGKQDGKWNWVNWHTGNATHGNKTYHQELVIYNNWNPGNYSYFKLQ